MAVSCDEGIAAIHAYAMRLSRICNDSDQCLEGLADELERLAMALHLFQEDTRSPDLIQLHELHHEWDKLELLLERCDEDLKSLDNLLHRNRSGFTGQTSQSADFQLLRGIQESLDADSADITHLRRLVRGEMKRRKILIEDLWDHLASGNLHYHFLARVVDWVVLDEELKQQRIPLEPRSPGTAPILSEGSRVRWQDEELSPGVLLEALPSKTPSPVPNMPTTSPVPKDKRYQATVEDAPDDDDDDLASFRSVDEPIREKTTSTENVEGNVGDEASNKAEELADLDPSLPLKHSNTDMIEKKKHQKTLQEIEEQIRRLKEEEAAWKEREDFRLFRHRHDTSDEMKLFDERQRLLENSARQDASYYVMPSGSTFSRSRIQDKNAHLKRTHLENLNEPSSTSAPPQKPSRPTPHQDSSPSRFFSDGPMHSEPSPLFDSPTDQPTPPLSPHSLQTNTNTPDQISIIEKPLPVTLEDILHGATKSFRLSRRTYDKYTGGRGSETRTLKVPIKKGLKPGSKIKFRKAGDQGPNTAQDIHFVVQYLQHRTFSCDGSNLYHELNLSADEAAVGWYGTITAIDGTELLVQVPPNCSHGWRKVYAGYGLPRSWDESVRGDLVVVVNITRDRVGVY